MELSESGGSGSSQLQRRTCSHPKSLVWEVRDDLCGASVLLCPTARVGIDAVKSNGVA